jgi:hypothetical protein
MLAEPRVTLSYYDLLIGLCDICNVLSAKGASACRSAARSRTS